MKKLVLAFAFLLAFTGFTFAQTSPTQDSKKKATTTKTAAGPTKKDGTPDMRYKANKEAPKTTHLKKDGTADKRFKENKKPPTK